MGSHLSGKWRDLPAAQVKTSNTCLLLQDLQRKWIIDKYLHDLI